MKRAILLSVLLCVVVAAPATSDECVSHPGTRVQYFSECACYACAYTGGGCTVCTDGGSTCYTDGATCGPLHITP